MVFIEFFEEITDYSPWFSLNFLKKSRTIVHGFQALNFLKKLWTEVFKAYVVMTMWYAPPKC